MVKSSQLEKDKNLVGSITEDVRNPIILQQEIVETAIKDVRNIFRLTKENEAIKNRVTRDI